MKWTAEQIEELKRLWAMDLTVAETARRLGMTRDAARHKAADIGLPKRDSSGKHRFYPRSDKYARPRLATVNGRILEPLFISFMDLAPGMCRFPVERGGQQFYCGRPQEHGTSYCDDCCRVAFRNYAEVVKRTPAPLRTPQNGRVAGPYREELGTVISLNTLIGDLSEGEMKSRWRGTLREVPFTA